MFNSALFCSLIQPLRTSRKPLKAKDIANGKTCDESAKPLQNGSNNKDKEDTAPTSKSSPKGRFTLSWCAYKVYLLDLVYCTGFWFIYGGHLVLLTFTPIRGSYLGFTKHQGAWLVSVCGIASGTLRSVSLPVQSLNETCLQQFSNMLGVWGDQQRGGPVNIRLQMYTFFRILNACLFYVLN